MHFGTRSRNGFMNFGTRDRTWRRTYAMTNRCWPVLRMGDMAGLRRKATGQKKQTTDDNGNSFHGNLR